MTDLTEPEKVDLSRDWIAEQRAIMATSSRYEGVKELDDGYAFRYPPSWETKVRRVADYLGAHYGYFNCEVEAPPRGPVWLRITGPEGTKDWLEQGFDFVSGRMTPDGTHFLGPWERRLRMGLRVLTSPLRVLPDFLILGAAKCGTTSLYSYLCTHPQVMRGFRKETYYFDMGWRRSTLRYRAQFPTSLSRLPYRLAGRRLLTGEATPCYLFDPRVPARVRGLLPDAKLIVLLRNPADRAYSFYCMMVRRGLESLPFREALENEAQRLEGEIEKMMADEYYFSLERHHHSYLARGIYVDQLEAWTAEFPTEQLLILSHDEMSADRGATVRRAVEFLGLPPGKTKHSGRRNFVPHDPMPAADREWLIDYFRPHNERLFAFLGERYDWAPCDWDC